jgi:hypothetical protein
MVQFTVFQSNKDFTPYSWQQKFSLKKIFTDLQLFQADKLVLQFAQRICQHQFDGLFTHRRFEIQFPVPGILFKKIVFAKYEYQWSPAGRTFCKAVVVIFQPFFNIGGEPGVQHMVLQAEQNVNAEGKWHDEKYFEKSE